MKVVHFLFEFNLTNAKDLDKIIIGFAEKIISVTNRDGYYLAGAIRIELISLVLETKAQPLYQTPKQRNHYKTKKGICQIFLGNNRGKFSKY